MEKTLLTLITAVGIVTEAPAQISLPESPTLKPPRSVNQCSASEMLSASANTSLVDADNSTCWDSGASDAMIYFRAHNKNAPGKMEDWLRVAMKLAMSHGIGYSGACHWYISAFIETLADLKGMEE